MATHSTEEINGHPRTQVMLSPGEKVALCRCFHSKEFPFCDGSHRRVPVPGKGPVIVSAPGEAASAAE